MTDNEKELFEALRDKRLWQANMIEGWSMKGVKKLQTDKYSEEVTLYMNFFRTLMTQKQVMSKLSCVMIGFSLFTMVIRLP